MTCFSSSHINSHYVTLYYNQMIILSIVITFLLFGLWIVYKYYYCPRKEMRRYKALFQNFGYRVTLRPFTFFGVGLKTQKQLGQSKYKDAYYFEKTLYSAYDVSIVNALDKVIIKLVNPDLIKDFLSPQNNVRYPKLQFLFKGVREVLGNGIPFTNGQMWKAKRKIMSKVFNFELLKENIPKINDICNRCFDQFDRNYKVDENNIQYNVLNLAIRIFNGVMLKCFFGCDQVKQMVNGQCFQDFMIKMINDASIISMSPVILLLGKFPYQYGLTKTIRDVKQSIAIFRAIAKELIDKRRQEVENEKKPQRFSDIIQTLIYQRKASAEKNEPLEYSDRDLIDEFSTFLVGGTDTTSRFFTMIVYYISQNPEIQNRLRQDVESIIKDDSDITYENLKKLIYIDWIQNETTRYYGPGTGIFPRIATVDNKIGNVPITKGTVVTIQPVSNHFNPSYFEEPYRFCPQRWEKECEHIHPYAFLGFSGGPRSCLGKQLAHLQSKIALIKLIKRYKKIVVPHPDITMCFNFLYEPSPFQTAFTK